MGRGRPRKTHGHTRGHTMGLVERVVAQATLEQRRRLVRVGGSRGGRRGRRPLTLGVGHEGRREGEEMTRGMNDGPQGGERRLWACTLALNTHRKYWVSTTDTHESKRERGRERRRRGEKTERGEENVVAHQGLREPKKWREIIGGTEGWNTNCD
jgi:hypothetical protein